MSFPSPSGRRRNQQPSSKRSARACHGTFEPLERRTLLAATPLVNKADEAITRVNATLLSLYDSVVSRGENAEQAARSQHLRVDAQERVGVTITADDVAAVTARLASIGFVATASYPALHFVEGLLPVRAMRVVASVASQLGRFAVLPSYMPITLTGSVNSEADWSMEADRVRATLPGAFNGAGVKIGVLSDSFDTGPGSYATDQGSGDLPAGVQVIQDFAGGSDEGRAMLQLIHDIAPGSPLAFATAFVGGQPGFANNITALANAGAKVIVDDVVYFAEPMFQDGVIAQAINNAATNQGVAYFSSAGNQASRAYESTTFQTTSTTVGGISGTWYDFDTGGGVDARQRITVPAFSQIILAFQWDDPFYTAGSVDTDLDLFLLNTNGNIVTSSQSNNITSQTPYEQVAFTNNTGNSVQLDVAIRRFTGPNPGRIKYVNYGGGITFNEFPTNSSTVSPHAAAANARAVAAVPYFDQTAPESFTSRGTSTFLFTAAGAPMAPEVRQTPQIAGIDGTNNSFFGSDFEGDGRPNFFGTSAAAPHVAAVAALVRQANPGFTPAQVYSRLETTADDITVTGAGWDNLTGFGLVNAFDAVYPTIAPATVNFSDGLESGALSSAYETRSTVNGRIQMRTDNAPATGTRHLAMDTSLGNGSSGLNEVTLHVNLSGPGTKTLSFRQKELTDEDDVMPATFTNSVNADGVALSVDGVNWFRLVSLTGTASTGTYTLNTFDLSAFAVTNGITLGADTRIRFQQFDTHPIGGGDGFFFDDISVTTASTGAIAGKTFHDFDNDGVFDAGETALSGVTVNLDLGNNGSIDATAVSNASGDYSFTGLANGTYQLTEVPPSGFAVQNTNQVIINAGQSFTGVNFANTPTGAVAFTGTAGGDTYLLRRSNSAAAYEVLIGGVVTHVIPQGGVTSFTFDLAGGNDSLTIDYVNSSPIPAGGFVRYDGGSNTDTDSLTVNGSGIGDSFLLVNGEMGAPPANSIVLEDLGAGTFPAAETVTVNGGAGADALTTGVSLMPGVLTYDGGTQTDSLVFNGSLADDTINVTSSGVTRGTQQVAHSNLEAVTINADFGFDTINVTTALPTTVNGGDGNDTVVYNGTAIADTLALSNQTITHNGIAFQYAAESLVINALGGEDNISAATTGGPTTVTLDGGTEMDTFNVTPSTTALFRVIGGTPTTPTGDTLQVTQAGAVQTGNGPSGEATFNEITYSNRQSIRYKEIETFGNGVEQPPSIISMGASPNPVVEGENLTLTASGVFDVNGGTLNVIFYRESNGTAGLQLGGGGDTQVGSDNTGPYSITIPAPPSGSYTFYAQATDSTNLTSNVVSATSTVIQQTSATPGTPDLVAGSDSGSLSNDNLTNRDNSNASRTLTFEVSNTVAGATVTIYADGIAIGSAVASGTITQVTTNGSADLTDGTHEITATQQESGKATSAESAALSIEIDTAAPAAPSAPDLDAASDSGISNSDELTNDTTPGFSGTAEAGSTVQLFAGVNPVGSGTASGGNWSITAAALADGPHAITATATDAAGNTSVPSGALDVEVDTAPPAVTAVFVAGTSWAAGFLNFLATSSQGEAAFGFRLDAANHGDELPWTNLNKVSVRFSQDVAGAIAQGDLALIGINVPSYALSSFSYDAGTFTATWTLAATAITADKLLLDLDGSLATGVTDPAGNALDGEWTNPATTPSPTPGGADTFPSGDGTAGGDFRFRLNVLPGDVNRSGGSVVGSDVTLVRNAQNAPPGSTLYTIFKDVNGSGSILGSDVTLVRNRQGSTLPAGEPVAPAGLTASFASSFASGPAIGEADGADESLLASLELAIA